jgi:hypothetical protein
MIEKITIKIGLSNHNQFLNEIMHSCRIQSTGFYQSNVLRKCMPPQNFNNLFSFVSNFKYFLFDH